MKKMLCSLLLLASNFVLAMPDLTALNNTSWQKKGASDFRFALRFNRLSPDATSLLFRGLTPCGSYIAQMSSQGDGGVSIYFSPSTSVRTEVCDDQAETDEFLKRLRGVTSLRSDADELVLFGKDQQTLVAFTKVEPVFTRIGHKVWISATYRSIRVSLHFLAGVGGDSLGPYLELTDKPGCVPYHGNLTVDGVTQNPDALGIPTMICIGRGFTKAEIDDSTFAKMVGETVNVHVVENSINFVNKEGNEIIRLRGLMDDSFSRLSRLHDTDWPLLAVRKCCFDQYGRKRNQLLL